MAGRRPYIFKQVNELEQIVFHVNDPKLLRNVLSELKHRKSKKRTDDLGAAITRKLSALGQGVEVKSVAKTSEKARVKREQKLGNNSSNMKPSSNVYDDKHLLESNLSSTDAFEEIEQNNLDKKTKMTNRTSTTYPDGFLTKMFEDMRKKLLDISGGRSRLLNLNQDAKGFVRIVDELPNQLAEHLLASKSFTMDSVDDPTQEELIEHGYLRWDNEQEKYVASKLMPKAREWAKIKGINVEYDLPLDSVLASDDRHQDNNIQTVMFDSALSTSMKKLANAGKSSIEETGNNILFLSLGFLEWTDRIGGNKRLAPLYMIPVKIEKYLSKCVTRYRIIYTGEDIIANLTLREKLYQDFEVELPSIYDHTDEDKLLSPEDYFANTQALLEMKKGDAAMADWRVRRFATLATLSLGRLLMYRDLDPAKWPEGENNLVEHEFIRKFFSDDESQAKPDLREGVSGSGESYILDDVPSLHDDFPMVEDADSSQMSALIDVLKGASMVVEGPPGTGKSQTITNLIAAAISQGKSVLFVAEKQAALDVVKRRMDKAGLGEFCLDLHSDKAQKRMVLDSFNERIQFEGRHYFEGADYELQVKRFERSRQQLQDYCLMVNRPWKDTGYTIHEILCSATRYAKDVAPLEYETIAPDGIDGESFTRIDLDAQLEQLELFFKYLDIVSQQLPETRNWSSHPWYGVNNKAITGADERQLQSQLEDWTSKLRTAQSQLTEVFREQKIECNNDLTLDELELWITDLKSVPPLCGHERIDSFKKISREDVSSLNQYVSVARDVSACFADLCKVFNQDLLSNLNMLDKVNAAMQAIAAYGVGKHVQFDDLARSTGRLEESISLVCSIERKMSELIPHLPIIYKQELEQLFSINQAGFIEFSGFVAHASALPPELSSYRDDIYDAESLPLVFTEFKNKQERLSLERDRLSNIFKLERLPEATEIRELSDAMKDSGLLSVFSGKWRKARKNIIAFTISGRIDKQTISKSLSELAVWKELCQELKDSVEYQTAFGREFNGIDTNIARVETLMTWYQAVRKDYGIGFGSRTVMANALFSLNKDVFRGIQQLHSDGINQEISELLDNLSVLASIFTQVDCISDTQLKLSPNGESLQKVLLELQVNLEGIQKFLVNPNLEQTSVLKALEQLQIVSRERDKLTSEKVSERYFDGELDLCLSSRGNLPKDFEVVEASLSYLSYIYNFLNNNALIELLTHRVTSDVVNYIVNCSEGLHESKEDALNSERFIMNTIGSDREQWSKGCGLDIDALCKRNELAVNSIHWLDSWTKYLHAKDRMQEGGQGKLKDYLAGSQYSYEYGEQVMKFAVFTCLANEVYKEQPELSGRSGHEQTAIQEQFRKYDDGLKELQRKRVAELALKRQIDQGTSGARVSSYTGKFLLQHEISKQRGHIAIRKLVERAGDAMLGYKPCFMMSPMAVAKYLPPGKLKFDLVVMDEASQVKPEFALSCFARGKQAVVVGDPKQLPPTSFFDRATSNDDSDYDEDKGVINDSESILEAIGSHYPKQMLKWHYRSRHESLIDFSNRHFYDSELVVFPSPWAQSEEFGVKFTHIKNGVFASGINNDEAKHIIGAVKQHVINNVDESLGIVAMNSKQRDQIEALLEAARSSDQVLDAGLKRDAQTSDPMFIKNLENVQGDERDVIIISFTYGPQNRGSSSIPQRFGPINSDQGWRRLNVLFTRAKKRIQVYSSMRSEQIVVTAESKRGVRALKNYLAYAESGDLTDQSGDSQGTPDSDFEIAVMKQLNAAGYQCVPQVGVAGFKIDVGVRDPGMPGRYLMGIECDGATYHSSKSTRDRDRVRQGVLEGLGWNIKRVWSTDWFKNPDAELKPIIEELNRLATPVRKAADQPESPSNVKNKHVVTEIVQAPHAHVAHAEVQEELKLNEAQSVQTLKSRLNDFGKNIIEREFPNTDKTKRLLRPEMVDMLDAERPLNLDEFAEYIPKYLRTYTSTDEASMFLGDVLEIIAVYEEMHSNVNSA